MTQNAWMHLPPSADQLLDIVAEVLEEQVMAAVPPALQHQVRVAANLSRIVQREFLLGPEAEKAETEALSALVGSTGTVPELRAEAVERIRSADTGDDFERAAWDAAVAICRRELAIVKPGHDSWEGE